MQNIMILWVCNKKPSKVSNILQDPVDNLGGWLDSACDDLVSNRNIQLYVMFPDSSEYEGCRGNFSFGSYIELNCSERFYDVFGKVRPDVIHIWGTEFPHSNEALEAGKRRCFAERVIISIQGLVSLYGKHHFIEGLPYSVVRRYTFRDFIKRNNIATAKKEFIKRGEIEIKTLEQTKYVIGRTDWDRAAVQMFNPDAQYYSCNESLRDSFYEHVWDINKINRNSIFISQSSYPIKGFHYLLEAMPVILKRHKDTHIYTTGVDLLHLTFKQKTLMTSYQKYILELIEKFGLEDHISFLGKLSEGEMCEQYLKANVFVCPSTIENSPNSVGEAMLVGCPVVTADVGGVKNMLTHGVEGYVYQSSAPYMLAYYVNKIFEDDTLALNISSNSRKHALMTHDREVNLRTILNIYNNIIRKNRGGGGIGEG